MVVEEQDDDDDDEYNSDDNDDDDDNQTSLGKNTPTVAIVTLEFLKVAKFIAMKAHLRVPCLFTCSHYSHVDAGTATLVATYMLLIIILVLNPCGLSGYLERETCAAIFDADM